jgi:hypothetical protein
LETTAHRNCNELPHLGWYFEFLNLFFKKNFSEVLCLPNIALYVMTSFMMISAVEIAGSCLYDFLPGEGWRQSCKFMTQLGSLIFLIQTFHLVPRLYASNNHRKQIVG